MLRCDCPIRAALSCSRKPALLSLSVLQFALVWGTSVRHSPQHCGLSHTLTDEDVVQIVTKTATEQKADKDYAKRVQAYHDAYKAKKKPLKS